MSTAATLLALCATALALVGLVLAATATPWRLTILAATFAHQLQALAPVGLVLALLAGAWPVAVVAGVLTVAVAARELGLRRHVEAPSGTPVTVLQANLWLGRADAGAIAALVDEHGVDLLAVQELHGEQAGALDAALAGRLAHHAVETYSDDAWSVGLWSRWPLSGVTPLDGFRHAALRATVDRPDGPLTVVVVHLSTPWAHARTHWLDELRALAGHLQPAAGPVLVAGDFNATLEHAQFRALLAGGYGDAAVQAGRPRPRSWPSGARRRPVIAIDHVLLRGATARSARTVLVAGSDHRGLLVRATLSA